MIHINGPAHFFTSSNDTKNRAYYLSKHKQWTSKPGWKPQKTSPFLHVKMQHWMKEKNTGIQKSIFPSLFQHTNAPSWQICVASMDFSSFFSQKNHHFLTTHPQNPNQKHFSSDSWKIALPMALFSYRKAFMPNDGKGFCRKNVPLFPFVSAEKWLHKRALEVFICLLLFIPWYIAWGAISIFQSSFPKLYKWPPLISATVGASYQFHFYAHS